MNVVEKLKTLGVEITDEIKKAFPDDMVSSLEVKKKKDRIEELEKQAKGAEASYCFSPKA